MTEVNRSNFDELIPEIISKIQKCSFIAIDAEYTGIISPHASNSLFDTIEERYEKLRSGFCNFQISQFGLALFSRNWERNEYFVEAYNIYLYPLSFDEFNDRKTMHCQISSLNFLTTNNFDFNKFIKEGAPYLRKSDEVEECRRWIRTNSQFMQWMELRDKDYFPKFIPKFTDEDVDETVDRLLGFTKVIEEISKSKKPIVGHNLLLDLLLLQNQFLSPLPPSYSAFKKQMTANFPIIFDTKHIAFELRRSILNNEKTPYSTEPELLFNTTLFELYSNTAKIRDLFVPFITLEGEAAIRYGTEIREGLERNLEKLKGSHCHEAGLDAAATGAIFLRLSHIGGRRDPKFLQRRSFPPTFTETLSYVNEWKNCVNVARAPINHIKIDGDDPGITKPNWILVQSSTTKILSISYLRLNLPKFGDVEILPLKNSKVLLACSNWNTARNVWACLEEEGFKLEAQQFRTTSLVQNFKHFLSHNFVLGTSFLGSFIGIYLIFRVLRQK